MKKRIVINGLPDNLKASYILDHINHYDDPILVVTSNTLEAKTIAKQLSVDFFPAPDIVPGEEFAPEKELIAERIRLLGNVPKVLIAPLKAVIWRTFDKLKIKNDKLKIKVGEDLDIEDLLTSLVEFGYKRQEIVGERGEFAVRGGIVDVFFYEPVRIEFFGDQIESIRAFDVQTQRSLKKLEIFDVLPIIESGNSSFFEHLEKNTTIFLDEPMQLKVVSERLLDELEEIQKRPESKKIDGYLNFNQFEKETKKFKRIINSSFESGIIIDPSKLPEAPKVEIEQEKKAAVKEGINRELLLELNDGDLVVHENYGISIYRGMKNMDIDGIEQEYLLLEYAHKDQVYVPLQQMGLIERYTGNPNPKIYRLHGAEWKKTKQKVKKGLKDLTKDLLFLYAIRQNNYGYAFPHDYQWEKELSTSFPYEETRDQQKAINDVVHDMESSRSMDRLVCGDVGYGKTEVAVRAAFKAAVCGKQVAILAPTTILVQQHFSTFKERLRPYPVRIEMLSRFKTKAEQKEIIEKVKSREVDIVIGTHRLLQKDITFHDLGLLVVDEEQRFGVSHKERIKHLRKNVDVLTLTATPIPRTLYFSLSGARDMSLINTAPVDRLPIRTHVVPWDNGLVREVVLRELDRGGQVYFVHNFVRTIDTVAQKVRRLIPEARIKVAHGQMKEDKLAKVMSEFQEKKFDILICTTIIESGLDIPNVNTMIVDHAERFGLAQLYQLRGRIGRSSNRAYAYLLYHKEQVLTTEALERLKAIQEFNQLGSGFRLAMRDLEIRGSGTLLGAKQHGHIVSVGFDMYCDMLDEAVKKAKGTYQHSPRQVVVDLKMSAYIPADYITDDRQRIATYRRLSILSSLTELKDIKEELVDRYGKIPLPLKQLISVINLKIAAQKAGIKEIKESDHRVTIEWFNGKHKAYHISDMTIQQKLKWLREKL